MKIIQAYTTKAQRTDILDKMTESGYLLVEDTIRKDGTYLIFEGEDTIMALVALKKVVTALKTDVDLLKAKG